MRKRFDLELQKFDDNMWKGIRFQELVVPPSQGEGFQHSPNLWDFLHACNAYSMRKKNQTKQRVVGLYISFPVSPYENPGSAYLQT